MGNISTSGWAVIPLMLSALFASTNAHAEDVDITKGRLTQDGPFAEQPIGAKNNSNHVIDWLSVECGFFHKGGLVATSLNNTRQVAPGQTAYFSVTAKVNDADSAKCRVSREDAQ